MCLRSVRTFVALWVLWFAAALLFPGRAFSQAVSTNWTPIGKGIINTGYPEVLGQHHQCGRIVQAAWRMDAVQGQPILWMGTACGGVWKSHVDSTGTILRWTPLTDNFTGPHALGAFLVNRVDSHYILVGPGGWSSGSEGNGRIYRTTNQGGSWSYYSLPLAAGEKAPVRINRIVDDRSDPTGNTVFACTSSGIYKSLDFGFSWKRVFRGITSTETDEVTDLFQDPITSSTWCAGAVIPHGILRSTLKGDVGTWLPYAGSSPISGSIGRVLLANTPANTSTMYALVVQAENSYYGTSKLNGVYRSLDYGKNWTLIYNKNGVINAGNRGIHSAAIACDPADANHLLFGLERAVEIGNATTIASGSTWPAPFDGGHDGYDDFLFRQGFANVVIASEGGYYLYTPAAHAIDDSGNLLGINATWLTCPQGGLAASRSNPDLFVAGLQDCGIVQGSASQRSLVSLTRGDGGQVSVMPDNSSVMSASGSFFKAGGYRAVSTDAGQHWHNVQLGLYSGATESMLIDPTPGIASPYLLTTERITTDASKACFRTVTDFTSSWRFASSYPLQAMITHLDKTTDADGITIPVTGLYDWHLFVLIGFTPGAGSPNMGALIRYDRTPPLPPLSGTPDARANADRSVNRPYTIYYTTGLMRPSRAYVSQNGGNTWVNLTGDLPTGIGFNKLVGNPTNNQEYFLATSRGVYRTDDAASHWYLWSTGLRTREEVQDIVVNSDGLTTPTIYIATKGRGFWQRLVQ